MELDLDAVSPIVDPRKDAVADRRADEANSAGKHDSSADPDVAKFDVAITIR
jgi:hypothetical protein